MTDKFTQEYWNKVELCRKLLYHICSAKETENLKPPEIRSAISLFFSEDVINKATNILFELGEK